MGNNRITNSNCFTVSDKEDIAGALAFAEKALGGRIRQPEELITCQLVCEELLLYLLQTGQEDLSISAGGLVQPYLDVRASRSRADLNTPVSEDSSEEIETEIRSAILEQYGADIDYRYSHGVNHFRIYPSGNKVAEIQQELSAYYEEAGTDAMQKPLAVLWFLVKKHPVMMILTLLNRTVKHLCALLLPVFASNIIEAMSDCTSFFDRRILLNIIFSVLSLTVNLVCATVDTRVYLRFVRQVESGFKLALIAKLQILSIRFFSNTPSGTVLSKLVSDAQFIKLLLHEEMTVLLHLLIDIVFVIIVSLRKMPIMLLFYAIVIPMAAKIISHYMPPIRESKTAMRKKAEISNTAFKEMLAMERLTRSHGVQRTEYQNISAKVRAVQHSAIVQDRLQIRLNNAGYGTTQGFRLLCLCVAVYLAVNGKITVGAVVLFQSLFDALINSVQKTLDEMPQITQGLDSLTSVSELLTEPDVEKNGTQRLPLPVRGEVAFENVVFRYSPDRPPILNGVSFHIPAGKSAAFAGRSGIGKSTILNLLLGLYSAESGSITIDGMDVDSLDKTSYRHAIAVVPQSPVLFSGTLWDNLVYGLKYVSAEQVLDVLKSVGLESLVTKHPDGLWRPIYEGGENLSGGQRQRIAIARALLRNPRIILFDEATSALDRESEQEVQAAIDAIMGRCTVLMVAHRLNTLRGVDIIFRLDDGRVFEVDKSTFLKEMD